MIRRFAIYNHVKKMVNINRSEYAAVIWSFVYFFSLLGSYYILRPIRDEMGVIAGIDKLQWLFTATFIAMLLAVPLFGYVTSRLQRKSFLPYIYYFFYRQYSALLSAFRIRHFTDPYRPDLFRLVECL